MPTRWPIVLLSACCLLVAATATSTEPLEVWVSIQPQAGLVERIGGERVRVHVLIPPAGSPATYEPTPRQLEALAGADLLVTIGVPFERTLVQRAQSVLTKVTVVDGLEGIERVPIGGSHAGHGDHDHGHEQLDPHVWLDPYRLQQHAVTVCEALSTVDPAHADGYRARLEDLEAQLTELDAWVQRRLESLRGEAVLVFHPAYGYFTRRYGLEQVAVEVSGNAPSPRQLAEVVAQARSVGARAVFVQPQFSQSAAEAVAEALDGEVVPLDPLQRDPIATIRHIADTIADHVGSGDD